MKKKEPEESGEKSPVVGDWVEVAGMAGFGRLLEIDLRRRRARVEMQNQEWVVPVSKIKKAEAPPPRDKEIGYRVMGGAAVYYEVDLHGEFVEEALELARRGLDQAVVNHLDRFKIIHGHGSGRVRHAIRKMLEQHPHVQSFRFGEPHEGGLACTVAMLRQVR